MSQNERSEIEQFEVSNFPNTLGVRPPEFTKRERTFFSAEHAVVGDDIVFHFYPEGDGLRGWPEATLRLYWDQNFPNHLSDVSKDHFKVDYPRLKACHVQEFEIDSWWMRAFGFGKSIPDVEGFINLLYDKLNFHIERVLNETLA